MAAIGRLNPVTGEVTIFDSKKVKPVLSPAPDNAAQSNINRSKKVHSLDDLIKANRK